MMLKLLHTAADYAAADDARAIVIPWVFSENSRVKNWHECVKITLILLSAYVI